MMQSSGGAFYVDASNETIVDPQLPPVHTHILLSELRKCEGLVQRDLRYAQLVAGASKMPMNMVWTARNQDQPVSDTDLAALRDVAWTDFIKKRYLPGVAGTTTVQSAAASMLEIVRDMNLQRRRFLIMGLHEQVEASEIQLVLHLCQAEVIRTDNYRATANRYRRHDRLFEAFALAVGAFVCASAPFTMGSGTGRYERDLQFEYKKQTTALFVWALRRVRDAPDEAMEEDYVARIARLIVVWPDDDSGGRRVGFISTNDDSTDSSSGAAVVRAQLLDAVAEAQRSAEKALGKVVKMEGEVKGLEKEILNGKVSTTVGHLEGEVENVKRNMGVMKEKTDASILEIERNISDKITRDLSEQMARSTVNILHEMNSNRDGFFGRVKEEITQRCLTQVSEVKQEFETIRADIGKMKSSVQSVDGHGVRITELENFMRNDQSADHKSRLVKIEQFIGNTSEMQRGMDLIGELKTMESNISIANTNALQAFNTAQQCSSEIISVKTANEVLNATISTISTSVAEANKASIDTLRLELEQKTALMSQRIEASETIQLGKISQVNAFYEQSKIELGTTEQRLNLKITNLRTLVDLGDDDIAALKDDVHRLTENVSDSVHSSSASTENIQPLIDSRIEASIQTRMNTAIEKFEKGTIPDLVKSKIEAMVSPLLRVNPSPQVQDSAAAATLPNSEPMSIDVINGYIDLKVNEQIDIKIQALRDRLDGITRQLISGNLDPRTLYGSGNLPDNASFNQQNDRREYVPSLSRPIDRNARPQTAPGRAGVRRRRSPSPETHSDANDNDEIKRSRGPSPASSTQPSPRAQQ